MTAQDDMTREEQLRRFGSWSPDGRPPGLLAEQGAADTLDAIRSRFGPSTVAKAASDRFELVRPVAVKLSAHLALVAKAGAARLSKTEETGLKQVLATIRGVLDGSLEPSALRQAAAQLQVLEGGTLSAPQPPPVAADDGSTTAAALGTALDGRDDPVAKSVDATARSQANLVRFFTTGQRPGAAPAPTTKVSKARPPAVRALPVARRTRGVTTRA
jgi:hypothetical protein